MINNYTKVGHSPVKNTQSRIRDSSRSGDSQFDENRGEGRQTDPTYLDSHRDRLNYNATASDVELDGQN